ncbi:MAG: Holliday junction resolvase RuvX [Gaiellales bacterium]
MRIVAVDYGSARTGVAVSDETGTLARPVGVVRHVRRPAGMAELVATIGGLDPERIVVGLPLTLRGEEGAQALETREFVAELAARCTVPVDTYDERFTTTLAASSGGPDEDAVAAAHLLQGYLTRLAG